MITGLEYFFAYNTSQCFILVATSKKLYQFKGTINSRDDRPWFANIFNSYLSKTAEQFTEFELSTSSTISGKLAVNYNHATKSPRSIAYLTEKGIFLYYQNVMLYKNIQFCCTHHISIFVYTFQFFYT